MSERPSPSLDAAIVLGLAETAVPFAITEEEEAERWLRILRLYGEVGGALQALGVAEAPLGTRAQPRAVRLLRRRPMGEDIVEIVSDRAVAYAHGRGGEAMNTVDILFALLQIYDKVFDKVLYVRGTTRDELLDRLGDAGVSVAGRFDRAT
jgi:hypothetical protein